MAAIDEFLPRFEFRERHARTIDADAEATHAALREVDLADSPLIAPLFALRSLPALFSRRSDAEALRAGRLGSFFERGFVVLRETPGRVLVLGSIGEFWRASGGIRTFAAAQFATDRSARCARLAWSFEFEPLGERRTGVVTETRIECNDAHARTRMRLYWWLIRPASGLVRREILRLLARRAMRQQARN